MDALELNNIIGTFLDQRRSGFVQACVFSTFEFDAICFIDMLKRILINGFIEFRIFVLSLSLESSRSKYMLKLMQLLCRFEFATHWSY
jgi:hypothetical protein